MLLGSLEVPFNNKVWACLVENDNDPTIVVTHKSDFVLHSTCSITGCETPLIISTGLIGMCCEAVAVFKLLSQRDF